ncbi:cyclin-dependent kinase 7 [Nematocida minor]|uniref:cyclin-dependent kinase 7 n=1 Tax=Nematocida minor TaxID=1912983 RepID=UPI0022211E72|nr:cyclin-dependent kinase 7 [Nematocida minor]KAI5191694.1 cyclin-dependent kinase 7 [Nematocida minor]
MDRVKRYTKEAKIGEGTYAIIYFGKEYLVSPSDASDEIITESPPSNALPGRTVAIKRIKKNPSQLDIEIAALREIKHLKYLKSEHIIDLFDIIVQDRHIHIILPYMESNLEVIIRSKKLIFMPQDVKAWMLMICKGLHECHSHFVIHRDIKPNNILVGKDGSLKLADFGISVDIGFPLRALTPNVVTRWYKAPEILLGCTNYTFAIDIWALGCLFAELLQRIPYLPGRSDTHQLELIYSVIGTPTEEEWKEIGHKTEGLAIPSHIPRSNFAVSFGAAGNDAIDLLNKMFVYVPSKRITIDEILSHPYFTNTPAPTPAENLPFDVPAQSV